MKYRQGKKRTMDKLRIDELSSVDSPAQEGARALILKRADKAANVAKRTVVLLTSEEDGHQHAIWLYDYDGASAGGETSYAKSEGEEYGHSHPWALKVDGSIEIGKSEGHSHTITLADFAGALFMQLGKHADKITTPETVKEAIMALKNKDGSPATTPEQIAAATAVLEAENTALKARAERGEKIAKLSGEELAHFGKLSGKEADDFLNAASDARATLIKAASDSTRVIYKDRLGNEYRASDDPRLVSIAKASDAEAKETAEKLAKAEKTARDADLRKRAESELANLPGTIDAKMATLAAIDAITDEAVRAEALKSLKAGDAAMKAALTTTGHGGSGSPTEGSAEAELDRRAKKRAAEKSISYEDAYQQEADASPALKKAAIEGKPVPN